MSRFTISQAARGAMPLFVGLAGPSGSGKTFSALRIATGIQRVCGGKIAVIDTEGNRAKHYAPEEGQPVIPGRTFEFQHLPFAPPFSPNDYWEAIEVCVKSGAKTIVIDSMSHEHEGPGGVLEMHEAEAERIAAAWKCSKETAQFPAWAEPKGQRRRLVNNILQVQVNLVLCFRAKRKVKMVKNERGKSVPTDQGWMPIAGDEYAFELTALGVLPPGSNGVPDWLTQDPGSEMITKRPAQFQDILKPGAQLSEEMGEAMARWSSGAKQETKAPEYGVRASNLLGIIGSASAMNVLETVAVEIKQFEPEFTQDELKALRRAYSTRKKEIEKT